MKKHLANIDLITLAVAVIGVLLRYWHLSAGPDSNGLYPDNHIAWTLLLCLSAAMVVALFLIAGTAGKSRSYSANFWRLVPLEGKAAPFSGFRSALRLFRPEAVLHRSCLG